MSWCKGLMLKVCVPTLNADTNVESISLCIVNLMQMQALMFPPLEWCYWWLDSHVFYIWCLYLLHIKANMQQLCLVHWKDAVLDSASSGLNTMFSSLERCLWNKQSKHWGRTCTQHSNWTTALMSRLEIHTYWHPKEMPFYCTETVILNLSKHY